MAADKSGLSTGRSWCVHLRTNVIGYSIHHYNSSYYTVAIAATALLPEQPLYYWNISHYTIAIAGTMLYQ